MSKPPKNYRWWQDHGQGWAEEVALRKARMPIYHLQEIFLEEYLSKAAPAKVLDFGCGFGRHLEYLRRVPKLDLYGFDQSESMVGAMSWATPAWRKKRISVGKPLNKLPYADDTFDVVFTVSVLIHVRPRDLDQVISELVRVCRGQVIHIENNVTDQTFETSAAHDGCWAHDLRAAYQRVAPKATFEVAHSMFEIEDVYRVSKSEKMRTEIISAARAARFRALDRSLASEIRSLRKSSSHAAHRAETLEHDRHDLSQRLEQALVRARGAEKGVDETRQRARSAEARFEETRTRLVTVQGRVAALRKNAIAADSRMSELEARLKVTIERARAAEMSAETLRKRAIDAESKHAAARGENEHLTRLATQRAAQVAELKPLADELRERALKAEESLESLRVRAKEAESSQAGLLARAQASEARVARAHERVAATAEVLAKQRERLAASQLEVKALGERARTAEGKVKALFDRARSAENRLAEHRDHADRLIAESADAASIRSAMEAELRSLRDREESATARVAELLERLEVEVVRADRLDAAVMLAQNAQERITEQERDAQSRLIALRHRSERAEAKAEAQRLRARAAEAELLRLDTEAVQLRREQALERERADVALGRIDDAHRAQEQVETELEALRGELSGILGR